MEEKEIEDCIEFETKYGVEQETLYPFKQLVENLDFKKFIYAQGWDYFYNKKGVKNIFARYRREDGEAKAEFTIKEKHSEKNSIKRTETNWGLTGTTSKKDVIKGIELLGFEYNTKLWKACHIYKMDDVTLVFYSVRWSDDELSHFIEIEVPENLGLTDDESWAIIIKYEALLAPLGITAKKRKRLSLKEMAERRK